MITNGIPSSHAQTQVEDSYMASITIRNLVKSTEVIQSRIGLPSIQKASRDGQAFITLKEEIAADIHQAAVAADRILKKHGESPGELAIRSRRAYQWLKYLDQEQHLEQHLDGLQRINLFLPDLTRAKRYHRSEVDFRFYNLGSLYKVSGSSAAILITAQEILAGAPDRVLIAILRAALQNEAEGDRRTIHEYTSSAAYKAARQNLEYLGMEKGSQAAGKHHDLEKSFQRVNQAYFDGSLGEPHLVWSGRLTHRKFGHYQWDIDTVMVSKSLDQSRVPEFVVDYVMFHELLHKKIGVKLVNQRRTVHTAAFRRQESRFKNIDQAQQWLNRLARKRK